MSQQTAFAVPKDKQAVTVVLDSGKALEGVIFLEYAPEELTIHHRMVAFLEDGSTFFPLAKKNDGTELINKRNIRLIELNISGQGDKVNTTISLMYTVNITAVFTDDSTLTGALLADVPLEKARLSDSLNLPDKFLNVKVDDKICYINKGSLRKVVYAAQS